MKKHLIAVAVAAAVAVPAVAQVSVSGTIDVTAQRTNKLTTRDAAVTTQVNTSNTGGGSGAGVTDVSADGWATSELVFQATEDLGGGLKATARFSQAITTNTFAAPGRDKYIDVAGGFGSVRLGRFNGAIGGLNAYSGAGSTNPGGDLNNMTNGGTRILGGAAATAGASFERNSGLIQFTSPSFSGLTVNALYGDNSTDTTSTANRVAESKITAFGAAYTAGPLKVEFASGQRKNRTASAAAVQGRAIFSNNTVHNSTVITATTNSTTGAVGTIFGQVGGVFASGFTREHTVSLGSTAEPALTSFNVGQILVQGAAAQLATDATHDFDWLGASYNFGVATVMASHSRRKMQSNTVLDTAQATLHDIKINSVGLMIPLGATTLRASTYTGKDSRGVTAADDVKLSGQQISAIYSLSKRTYLYAAMGESDVARDTTAGTAAERKEKTTGLGLVHSF